MITLILALIIFLSYTAYVSVKCGGMLESISASYYKVPPILFTGFIFSVGILAGVSGNAWTFAAGGVLCGVGVAANFRWIAERNIHIACAVVAILLGFVSITVMGYWYLTVFFAIIALLFSWSDHPCRTWIVEYYAFLIIFAGLLIEKL